MRLSQVDAEIQEFIDLTVVTTFDDYYIKEVTRMRVITQHYLISRGYRIYFDSVFKALNTCGVNLRNLREIKMFLVSGLMESFKLQDYQIALVDCIGVKYINVVNMMPVTSLIENLAIKIKLHNSGLTKS